VLRVLLAPNLQAFTLQGVETFLSGIYRVGVNSDRMGYRLEGPAVTLAAAADILSEGLAAGMVQIPADGQPIVLMSDCQTTGGYVCIGSVSRADLPLLAQCPPGAGEVRFRAVTLAEAQRAYRQQQLDLDEGVVEPEDDQLLWAGA
jgi:antagonist of KipI